MPVMTSDGNLKCRGRATESVDHEKIDDTKGGGHRHQVPKIRTGIPWRMPQVWQFEKHSA